MSAGRTGSWSMVPAGASASRERILVIGAGMAGLVAGRLLHDSGCAVTLLEARARIGGRVCPDMSLGVPIDLGGSWIHGADDNPLTDWCAALGVEVVQTAGERRLMENGVASDLAVIQRHAWRGRLAFAIAVRLGMWRSRWRAVRGRHRTVSLADVAEPILRAWWLPALDRRVVAQLVSTGEGVQGAPADRLAIEEWFPNDAFGVNAMPRDGFATLLQDAVQGLDVRLDTPVQRLLWQTEGVVAETASGRFAADRAVVTLPVGLLRDGALAFDPPLPMAQRAAIGRIGYGAGVLGKIYLRFDRPFWPRDVYRFVGLPLAPDRRGVFNTWLSLERETGAPVLLSFANGQAALRFERECSDAQVLDEAMASLRRLFGSVPEPAAFRFTRWLADPWSAGSYSYPALGSLPGDRVTYARPLADRVFFAGEATESGDYGTVQAALRSGEHAAEAVFRCATGQTPVREMRPWRFRTVRTA